MDVRSELEKAGCTLEGDYFFALKKPGNVSRKYINLDPAFTYPQLISDLSKLLLSPWHGEGDIFAAPATGGIPLLYSAASHSFYPDLRVVWADKQKDGSFAFERMGFAKAVHNKNVVVFEDITSTGGSAQSVVQLVKDAGGTVIGASCVWNRGNVTAGAMGVPKLFSLVSESVQTWSAGEHEKWGIWPLVEDIGHPEHFPDYPGPRIKLLA